jgi:ABC-type phosphate transport system auxiliary subunit
MGGKKKAGKKGKKGKKEEKEPIDEYTEMRVEQLNSIQTNLKEQLEEAKIKRNMLQIEKDMIHDFYHNTREEIKELEARIRNFDTKMQEAEISHRTDVASHL